MNSFNRTIAKSTKLIKSNAPSILTALGIAGMITTVVFAVQATPKALKKIDERKAELDIDSDDEICLSKKEIVRVTWRCYVPAAISGVCSIACLVASVSTSNKRHLALAALQTATESALCEYKDRIIEAIGTDKEKEVRDSIIQSKMDKQQVREVILTDQSGSTVCFDVLTSRYFKSDREKIEKVVNDLNRLMRDEMYIYLNDFYREIGLDETKVGNMLGWDIDRGYIEIRYSSKLTDNGVPCLVIDYSVPPTYIK